MEYVFTNCRNKIYTLLPKKLSGRMPTFGTGCDGFDPLLYTKDKNSSSKLPFSRALRFKMAAHQDSSAENDQCKLYKFVSLLALNKLV